MQHTPHPARAWMAGLCLLAGLGACSSPPRPNAQLAVGQASVDAARMAGGSSAAPLSMNAAQDKLARAQAAERAGDRVLARRLAEEADLDAQLARARADAEKSRLASAEVDASLRTLRDELNRPAGAAAVPPTPRP